MTAAVPTRALIRVCWRKHDHEPHVEWRGVMRFDCPGMTGRPAPLPQSRASELQEWLRTDQVARLLNCSPTTVARWVRRRGLPAVRNTPTSPWRFRREDVQIFATTLVDEGPARSDAPVPGAPHGTYAGYNHYLCGCGPCIEAGRVYRLGHRKPRRRKVGPPRCAPAPQG